MPKVQVLDTPVRYDNVTYLKGETIEMKAAHVNESLVSVVAEAEKPKKEVKKEPKKVKKEAGD